jgi:DNA-binding NarL/FixJ family response regulator
MVRQLKVLLVEDDPLCRARLVLALDTQRELTLLADVGSVAEATVLIESDLPDVMVVDIGLPDGSGLDLIRRCKELVPNSLCLVNTVYGDEAHVLAALASGATGYLLKDAPLSDLGEAILSAVDGGAPISPSIASALLTHLQPPRDQTSFDENTHLSPRESEVLDYLARGFSRSEISDTLGISINTVSIYIKNIYRKLEVNSGKKALFEARRQGLLREGL